MKISVVIFAYNEAERIRDVLDSFSWADELIVFDKSSTDTTCAVAAEYGAVHTIEFSEGSGQFDSIWVPDYVSNDWIFLATCSDIIDRKLGEFLANMPDDYQYDVIAIPFKNYIYGISSKSSPWPITEKSLLARKDVVNYKNILHQELQYTSNRQLIINGSNGYVHHFSNSDIDSFLKRSIRYAVTEGKHLRTSGNVPNGYFFMFKVLFNAMFRRKTIFAGQNFIVVIFSYIICQGMIYLYARGADKHPNAISLPDVIALAKGSSEKK